MKDPYALQGKVALVTGSGRGLGFAMARRLAELGARVAIHARNHASSAEFGEWPDLHAAADHIGALATMGDLANPEDTVRIAAEVVERLGPIDVLVNCAGGDIAAAGGKPNPNDALHIKLEDVRSLIDRNFLSTLLMCQAVVPGMVERRTGSVVNIASSGAHEGGSPEVVYSSLKAAVVHLTRCLAAEVRPHGVRVNCVSPGPTLSARFMATRPIDPLRVETDSLDRYGRPEEIADAVVFLAGEGSRFVHGQVLCVDGGRTLFPG